MSSNNRNRRWAGGVSVAVGTAFAAALIGLANAPAARADTGDFGLGIGDFQPDPFPDPFEELFGDSGINSWTPSADSFLASSDPTLAGNMDASVDQFQLDYISDEQFSQLVWHLDPSAFSADPFSGGVPLDATGEFALGLDYTVDASGLGPTVDPAIFDLALLLENILPPL
jgi:hypothetical protein